MIIRRTENFAERRSPTSGPDRPTIVMMIRAGRYKSQRDPCEWIARKRDMHDAREVIGEWNQLSDFITGLIGLGQ